MKFCLVLFVFCCSVFPSSDAFCFSSDSQDCNSTDNPLLLSQILEKNQIQEAQNQSRVIPDFAGLPSYSGYFTVDKNCESNLFFWFFPAQENWEKAPVVLWLQGNPGMTFMVNLFEELGPLTYRDQIGKRPNSWNVKNNLLFIDQPVGAGYSFTGKDCFATNETTVGNHLYSAVLQFFKLFPQLSSNKFYIAGHSYAGHFIPALGHTIHTNNPSAEIKINLTGMMIGNGWMDARYQYDLGTYLYQLGLIDDKQQQAFYKRQEELLKLLRKREWESALYLREEIAIDMFENFTGDVSDLNYLQPRASNPDPYESFIIMPSVRKLLHVGNTEFFLYNKIVYESLGVDLVLSVKKWVEELLQHYFIVFYSGQLDVVCPYPQIVNFQNNLDWAGKEDFKNAERLKWCVGDKQVGYFKGVKNMFDVFVRNAGHRVTYDQPELTYMLINAVTSGSSDNLLQELNVCSQTTE